MWYVGLDWADTHHDVEVLDEAGKRVGVRRFAHSHDGLNELKEFLSQIAIFILLEVGKTSCLC